MGVTCGRKKSLFMCHFVSFSLVPLDLGQRSQEITSFVILALNPCNQYDNLNHV